MPLVVVHGDDDVEVALRGAVVHRIRGNGADCVDPRRPGLRDGGGDLFGFLGAEKAPFSGMGVQAGHGNAGRADAQIPHGRIGKPDDPEDPLLRDQVAGPAE